MTHTIFKSCSKTCTRRQATHQMYKCMQYILCPLVLHLNHLYHHTMLTEWSYPPNTSSVALHSYAIVPVLLSPPLSSSKQVHVLQQLPDEKAELFAHALLCTTMFLSSNNLGNLNTVTLFTCKRLRSHKT